MKRLRALLPLALALAALPAPPLAAQDVRPIPPPGVPIPDDIRKDLTFGIVQLGKEIEDLHRAFAGKPDLLAELPNVEIFWKAVDWAVRYGEFFDAKQFDVARVQLQQGMARAAAMRKVAAEGGAPANLPWNFATGLVVRGYRSAIDGSVQPYGLLVPEVAIFGSGDPRRLDIWFRGRAEKSVELQFIDDRQRNKGEFAPEGAFVLHPFGRYCNANKFAGETDTFEALADVKKHYRIDERRISVRGFSMGGAAAWQFATHHSGLWAAAAPGAGFAETAEFFKSFAPAKTPPPWWEQVLWRWYDATTMSANLANVPTIAYSGELDGQKQAADIMLRFAEKEGLAFPHIIGPQTAHKYHPDSKKPIEEFVTAAVEKGNDPFPRRVRLVTHTLLYPRAEWLEIGALERHWERAEITAEIADDGALSATTHNVSDFTVTLPPAAQAQIPKRLHRMTVDGQPVGDARVGDIVSLARRDGKWHATDKIATNPDGSFSIISTGGGGGPSAPKVRRASEKTSRVCGPIDHAFMSRFVFVRPTGKPVSAIAGAWARAELEHAVEFWRRVFRGNAPVKNDTELTDDDFKNAHLVLFGDPSSNQLFRRFETMSFRENGHRGDPLGLPFQWSEKGLVFRGQTYDAAHHALALIFPNPLNPRKYLVLNSGPTFREQALLNNSDQTPKLPDWAVIDLRTPPDARWPGLVVDAGFFDEGWQLPR